MSIFLRMVANAICDLVSVSSPLKVLIISILDIFWVTANGLFGGSVEGLGGDLKAVLFEVGAGGEGGEELKHCL